MRIHKEGTQTIVLVLSILLILNLAVSFLTNHLLYVVIPLFVASVLFFTFILRFFRNPVRTPDKNADHVLCPADGKVVVIEEVEEPEYFKDKRIQISIFMSPFDVHVNRYPISGKVVHYKYHPGKFLVAYHPKSSTDNERTTTVIKDEQGREVLVRQIAGAVARRIVPYVKQGEEIVQGDDLGFIKFGSRVDVFLPIGTNLRIKLDDIVIGNKTILAEI